MSGKAIQREVKDFLGKIASGLFLVLGVLSAGLGLKGFLLPLHFIDGGVTGVSMLVSALSKVSLPLLILVINAPFIFIGYRQIGKMFALKSALAIAGLALCLAFLPYPVATNDKLLAAVFGGFFLGAGIGLSIRAGGVLDGTEVMALILSKKMGTTVGDIILLLNIVIFSVAAIFLGLEPALYSVLTYFSVSKTMDFLIHGIEEYNGVTIISARSEEIKGSILNDLGRGITVYKGMGGLTNAEQDILFCVVTRLEIPRLKNVVKEIDEAAFIAVHRISDATGGVMKKQVLH
jgi:uncharacterized membrane-anchored protein YitT (DUF2179 family)